MASLEISKYADHFKVNQLPVVTITSPDNNSFFPIGSNIPIITNAFDVYDEVIQVELYEKDNLLFTDTQKPWTYIWPNVKAGNYIVIAVATDDSNASKISLPINIIVTNDSLVFQAEEASISEGFVDSQQPGYTGTGYVNLDNRIGTYLECILSIPTAGNWAIKFRFANGSSNNRPCKIELNGTLVDNAFNFEPTGSWDKWIYSQNLNVEFKSGTNTLRITGITSESAPNLDFLIVSFSDTSTNVSGEEPTTSLSFNLYPNYPNPFNPTTTLRYSVQYPCKVKLTVYNMAAQHVTTLVDKRQPPGTYTIHFDAAHLPSSIYLYKLQAGDKVFTKKMLLVR